MTKGTKGMSDNQGFESPDALADAEGFGAELRRLDPEQAEAFEASGLSRRSFMGLMSASMALGGIGTGCLRKPVQYIMPYTNRPEDLIPGKPRYFASNLQVGSSVLGVIVESQDGRPTKIEGNPAHPVNRGRTDALTQALILGLYDPDRSQSARISDAPVSFGRGLDSIDAFAASMAQANGAGFAFLVEDRRSPTFARQLDAMRRAYPQLQVFVHDPTRRATQARALSTLGAPQTRLQYDLSAASVIVALDSDFMGTEADNVAGARGYADGRRMDGGETSEMNRLYAVEPLFTVTGAAADNRLQVAASQVGKFARALAHALVNQGLRLPTGVDRLAAASDDTRITGWAAAVAEDLLNHRRASAVLVGDRQPPWVHGLALAINEALENRDRTFFLRADDTMLDAGDLSALAEAIDGGRVRSLAIVGADPVYTGGVDLDFATKLGRLETSIHLGYHVDPTARAVETHIPRCHDLEAWSDLRAVDGTTGIQQPLIAPLFESLSELDFLARMLPDTARAGGGDADGPSNEGYARVRATWRALGGADFERTWRRWLHQGFIDTAPAPTSQAALTYSGVLGEVDELPAPTAQELEVVFTLDTKTLDGRYANNAWLQELPDPITKLTWDNAALVGVNTARALGVSFGRAIDNADVPVTLYGQLHATMATIRVGDRDLDLPLLVTPGVADNTIVLPLGYGRRGFGRVAEGAGFDTYALRTSERPWIAPGARVTTTRRTYTLATTQDHGSVEGRPLALEASLDTYREQPYFALSDELLPAAYLRSLWTEPLPRDGQQWGMTIDLTTCTGCNTCTIACQAENNISVVGKARVLEGREMSWIRLDRYYSGDADDPQAYMQPVACMHCENAPCEQVCPVAATVHGPEGTNDMAYNRCIGTRYCANNCPFKVRRFNFFNFARENDEENPLYRMQKNPDVTVRFRGVMEKCSYCIQRVNEAKIHAKVHGTGVVPDGAITPACGQACPTDAIVFGDINDPNSRVSRMKARNRNYAMLSWLNIHPRTTYLAKIRNPNPRLNGRVEAGE